MFEPAPDLPRLVSFLHAGRPGWGVLRGDMVRPIPGSLRAALDGAGLGAALARAAGALPLASVELTIPLPDPEKIICVGANFPDRTGGQEAPPNPSLAIRLARSFTAHGKPLIRPSDADQLDCAGEIAVVIGKTGRRIPEDTALDHVAGLTLANDGTLRDRARPDAFNVTAGKNFDRSGSMGPWLVPFRSPAQLEDIALETLVNGERRQSDRSSRMIFPVRRIIAYVSTFTTLVPGDTILCGTPARARVDPPVWLTPGDVVEVRAEGIGRLVNTVADEQAETR